MSLQIAILEYDEIEIKENCGLSGEHEQVSQLSSVLYLNLCVSLNTLLSNVCFCHTLTKYISIF